MSATEFAMPFDAQISKLIIQPSKLLFWVSVSALVYAYLGYPLLVLFTSKLPVVSKQPNA